MDINKKSLPSEKLQKEFEDNPFKILENIRTEEKEEKNDNKQTETKEDTSNNVEAPLDEKHMISNKEKRRLEPTMSKENAIISLDNEKNAQNNYLCKKDYNHFINNINNNSILFYNSKLNYDKNSNTINIKFNN